MRESVDVTVVVLCGQGCATLDRALQSVSSQVHVSSRLLLCGVEASPRYFKRIEREAAAAGAGVVLETTRQAAIAKALERTETSHVAFLHDVDWWAPAYLSVSLSRMATAGAGMAISRWIDATEDALAPSSLDFEVDRRLASIMAAALAGDPRVSLSSIVAAAEVAVAGYGAPPWASEAEDVAALLSSAAAGIEVLCDRLSSVAVRPQPPFSLGARGLRMQQAAAGFSRVIRRLPAPLLGRVLDEMTGHATGVDDDLVAKLFGAAQWFWGRDATSRLRAEVCIQEAFERHPRRASQISSQPWSQEWMQKINEDLCRDFSEALEFDRDYVLTLERERETLLSRVRARLPLIRSRGLASRKPADPDYELGQTIDFASPAGDQYVVSGFSNLEAWGRWTIGYTARLRLRIRPVKSDLELMLFTGMSWSRPEEPCKLRISVNGEAPSMYQVHDTRAVRHPIFTDAIQSHGTLDIRIDVIHPKEAGEAPHHETRRLGFGLAALKLDQVTSGGDRS